MTTTGSLFVPSWIGVAPLLTLTGPIVHAVHGRVMPAVVSLLGWATVSFIAAILPFTYALGRSGGGVRGCTTCPNYDEGPHAAGDNIVASVVGSSVMTLLDVWLARSF